MKFILILALVLFALPVFAGEKEELQYQKAWLQQVIRANRLEIELAQIRAREVEMKLQEIQKKELEKKKEGEPSEKVNP